MSSSVGTPRMVERRRGGILSYFTAVRKNTILPTWLKKFWGAKILNMFSLAHRLLSEGELVLGACANKSFNITLYQNLELKLNILQSRIFFSASIP